MPSPRFFCYRRLSQDTGRVYSPNICTGQRIEFIAELLDVLYVIGIHLFQYLSIIQYSPPPDKKSYVVVDITAQLAQFINQRILV